MPDLLRERLDALRARIARACAAAGRDPASVGLVAVTKGAGAAAAAELCALGQLDLGESRVQALEAKAAELAARGLAPRWHLVGHLQRNKARRAVELAAQIHSVDSPRLIESLAAHARSSGRRPGVWLEVELAGVAGRTGLAPQDLPAAVEQACASEVLELLGLMTIAPPPGAEPGARAVFRRLAQLRETLPAQAFAGGRARLSMGMSSDFEEAILEGADVVRVGSALFEPAGARSGG